MKAPDKLYISKNIYGTFMYQVPNPDDKTEVEYIRADYIIDALRMEYEKGRADAIAHPTGGELLHILNKGHKQGYKEATDKALEWVKSNADRYTNSAYPIDEYFYRHLKQHMEEQQ